MRAAPRTDIETVLCDVRSAIEAKNYQLRPRKRNNDTLAGLGFTIIDAFDSIYELTVDEYDSGPLIDRDDADSPMYWVFKKPIWGRTVYIKLKILEDTNQLVVKSFHTDNI